MPAVTSRIRENGLGPIINHAIATVTTVTAGIVSVGIINMRISFKSTIAVGIVTATAVALASL